MVTARSLTSRLSLLYWTRTFIRDKQLDGHERRKPRSLKTSVGHRHERYKLFDRRGCDFLNQPEGRLTDRSFRVTFLRQRDGSRFAIARVLATVSLHGQPVPLPFSVGQFTHFSGFRPGYAGLGGRPLPAGSALPPALQCGPCHDLVFHRARRRSATTPDWPLALFIFPVF